jgi:hypothetical protein
MNRPRIRNLSPDVLLSALLLGAMALLFGELFWHPNHLLFATGGDGLKNYFTAAWAVGYDEGLRFTGMNYPYGEHITYTDAQPLLVGLLRVLQSLGISLDGRVPGVLNALMLFSLLPAAWCLRRIGRHYGLPQGMAIAVALLVVLLSPQIHRWQGHYALGYTCFVPMLWWGVLRLRVSGRPGLWTLALLLLVAGFGLVHLYYLMIGAFALWTYAGAGMLLGALRPGFAGAYTGAAATHRGSGAGSGAPAGRLSARATSSGAPAGRLSARTTGSGSFGGGLSARATGSGAPVRRLSATATALRAGGAGVGAFVFVYLFLQWTDLTPDRPAAPFGFTFYRAGLKTVFFSATSPVMGLLKSRVSIAPEQAEGLGYVGFPGVLLVFWLALRFMRRMAGSLRALAAGTSGAWRRFRTSLMPILPDDLAVWVGSALVLLFLAMALPFRWGLEHWLDYVAPLKQFRSPGRLVFVFYPIWAVFAALMMQRWYRAMAMRHQVLPAVLVLVLVYAVWTAEAVAHARHFRQTVQEPNTLAGQTFALALKNAGHSPDQFQAMLTLPFYHMGSEKLYIDKGNSAMGWGMQAAYQTGIPLINVMMSRTSLAQTLATTSLVSRYGPEPGFLEKLDHRPVLLLINRAFSDPRLDDRFSDRERALILAADTVYLGPDFSLWSLEPERLNAGAVPLTDPALEREGVLWHDGFDAGSEEGLFGRAKTRPAGPWMLAEVPMPLSRPSGAAHESEPDSVEVSLWLKAYLEHASFPDVLVEWLDEDHQPLWTGSIITKQTLDVQPGWVRASRVLERMPEAAFLRITVEGVLITVDGLLVQRVGAQETANAIRPAR